MINTITKQPLNNLIRSAQAGIVPVPQIVVENSKEVQDYYASYGTLLSLVDTTAKTGYFAARPAVPGQLLRFVALENTSFNLADTSLTKTDIGIAVSSISGANITFASDVTGVLCIGQTITFTIEVAAADVVITRTVSAMSVGDDDAVITVTEDSTTDVVGSDDTCYIYTGVDIPMLAGDILDLYVPSTYSICPSVGYEKDQMLVYVIG